MSVLLASRIEPAAPPAAAPVRVDRRLLLTCALLLGSTIAWRKGVYYSGGLDPVVSLKALLNFVALALAFSDAQRAENPRPVGTRSIWLLVTFAALSAFGGWAHGSLVASGVLAIRLILTGAVIAFMLRRHSGIDILRAMSLVMGTFGLLGAVTGITSISGGGRLEGGIPPLAPNEIGFLCAVPVLVNAWRCLNEGVTRRDVVIFPALLMAIWLSGSRTALGALVLAIILLVLQSPRLPVSAFTVIAVALPAALFAVFGTGLVSGYIGRGGSANVGTLNSRDIAWSAALKLPGDFYQQWFGGGLALKQIPVQALYWDVQGLDSSWISALVQAGLLGVALLALWSITALWSATWMTPPARSLWIGLLVFLILRSFLESGLLDSSPAFLVFFLASVATERTTRDGPA